MPYVLLSFFILFCTYRLGLYVPLPFSTLDFSKVEFFSSAISLGVFNTTALRRFSVFSIGILPFITSSIVLQLVKVAFKGSSFATQLSRDSFYNSILYITTLFVATLQGCFLVFSASSSEQIVVYHEIIISLLTLVAGAASVIWISKVLGNLNIGSGVSFIIFINIVDSIVSNTSYFFESLKRGIQNPTYILLEILLLSCVFLGVIFCELAYRPISVQYPNIKTGFLGQKNILPKENIIPLKLNSSGVISVVFASSIASIIFVFFGSLPSSVQVYGSFLNILISSILIAYFVFFYTPIVVNSQDLSGMLKKNGLLIKNIRPGERTKQYIDNILFYLNCFAVCYLLLVVNSYYVLVAFNAQIFASGVSIMIVVSVIIDVIKRVSSFNLSHSYEKYSVKRY